MENALVRYDLSAAPGDEYISGISRKREQGGLVEISSSAEPIGFYLFSAGERYRFTGVVNTSLRETTTADGTGACVFDVTRRYEADNGRDDDITVQTTTAMLAGQPGATTRIEVTNRGSDAAAIELPASFIERGIRLGTVELAAKGSDYRFYVPGSGLYAFENTSYWETFALDQRRPAVGVFDDRNVLAFAYVDGSTPPAGVMTEDGDDPRQNSDSLAVDVGGVELGPDESAAWTVGTATFPMGMGLPDISVETLGQARNLTRGQQDGGESVSVTATGSTVMPGDRATTSITVENDGTTPLSPTVTLPSLPSQLSIGNLSVDQGQWDGTTATWSLGELPAGESASASASVDVPGVVRPGSYPVPVRVTTANDTTSATATITVERPPDVATSARSVRFGSLTVGDAETREVTVRNRGAGTLTIDGLTLVGSGAEAFTVTDPDRETLGSGETVTLTVTIAPDTTGANSATLQVATNDPDEPVLDVWLTNTETVVEMTRKEADDRSSMNVTMRNVGANTSHTMRVGSAVGMDGDSGDDAEQGPSATITQLNFTTNQNVSDMRMNVTQSDRRMRSTPETNLSNGSVALNYFTVDHSVSNDAFSSVSITVEVAKSKVAAMAHTDPDEVALYRHGKTGWAEVPTRLVGETATHYRYLGAADGFSEWATGAKQPQFRITQAQVNVSTVRTGRSVLVRVRITNEGGADGQFNTDLLVNDDPVASRQVSIASGGTRQVTFDRAFDEAGQYEVKVNDRLAGRVNVSGSEASNDTGGEPTGLSSIPLVPLAAAAVVLVAALVGGLLYTRRD